MTLIEEINQFGKGAIFRRADLHIHSYGIKGSDDVLDKSMTPKNIIETAITENLQIISITDHNSIGNVEEAIDYAHTKQILVIPGVEIATIQGSLLLYFSSFKDLNSFFGKLEFSPDNKICVQGIVKCLDIAEKYSGFGIAAHIELGSGIEKSIPKYGPAKEGIIKHKSLLGLEISSHESINWFSGNDDKTERKGLFKSRKKFLKKEEDYELAKVMSSDAHSLKKLGINATGNKKLTRIKMDELSFESFKIAFLDPVSRIRIEELIPNNIPHFVGIKVEGGFLSGQAVRLSKNLTCIIGGRGTGKSTLLESLRVASGNTSNSELVDSEVWPDKINLIFQDETGREQTFLRERPDEVINITDTIDGIISIPIESYGQGDTATKIQNCDKDPTILLSFFDEFIELDDFKFEEEEVRQNLFENQTVITELLIEVNTISNFKRLKKNIDDKIEILKEKKVRDIVIYQENLVRGREFRENLKKDLESLIENIRNSFSDKTIYEKVVELDESTLLIGEEQVKKIKEILDTFFADIENISNKLDQKTKILIEKLKGLLKDWQDKEQEILRKIDEKRKELEVKGIPLDMAFIRKVTQDSERYKIKLEKLYRKKKQLDDALKEKNKLVQKRRELKNKIFQIRNAWAKNINKVLNKIIIDYQISIKFKEGKLSQEFQELLKEKMGWRTSQVPKAKIIAENISPMEFLDEINSGNITGLKTLRDNYNSKIFTPSDIKNIFEAFNKREIKSHLENIIFEDYPRIIVTKFFKESGKPEKTIIRDFTKLSLGQQQSVLLSIILTSKSRYPLIIDQPEDNLDSEFIYKTIVKNLKRIKEYRQVIVVTHNANIAVLGDAELIIPLKSTRDKGSIIDRGSIDKRKTKKITCNILEGSEQAFKKRREIYDLD